MKKSIFVVAVACVVLSSAARADWVPVYPIAALPPADTCPESALSNLPNATTLDKFNERRDVPPGQSAENYPPANVLKRTWKWDGMGAMHAPVITHQWTHKGGPVECEAYGNNGAGASTTFASEHECWRVRTILGDSRLLGDGEFIFAG